MITIDVKKIKLNRNSFGHKIGRMFRTNNKLSGLNIQTNKLKIGRMFVNIQTNKLKIGRMFRKLNIMFRKLNIQANRQSTDR